MSSESTISRTDCGFGGVPDPISKDRVRGIRVFDISDIKKPKLVTTVQTCRGSHTHTVVTQPGDNDNVYIYVSGTRGRPFGRGAAGMPGRRHRRSEHGALPARSDQGAARGAGEGGDRQLAAHLQRPAGAAAQCRARRGRTRRRRRRRGCRSAARRRRVRRRLPRVRRCAGCAPACAGRGGRCGRRGADAAAGRRAADRTESVPRHHGVSGDRPGGRRVRRPRPAARHPRRRESESVIDFAADQNMSFWHSATFSNDGKKVLFTDEWGGGIVAALPRHRQAGVGRQRALHHRRTTS